MQKCRKCSNEIDGNYCENCWEPLHLENIDKRYFINEITSIFNLHSGFLYSLVKLLTLSGECVKRYISDDRSNFIKPIIFILFAAMINTLVMGWIPPMVGTEGPLMSWIINNQGNAFLALSFIMAFFIKIFFKKNNYNIYELFVLMCFLCGTAVIMDTVYTLLFQLLLPIPAGTLAIITNIWLLLVFAYFTWGVASFYDKKKPVNYIKGFLCTALPMIIITTVAVIIDFILKIGRAHV